MKVQNPESESYATTKLRELPKDTKIYTSLVSVSKSGMTRQIKAYAIVNNEFINLMGLAKDFPKSFKIKYGAVDSFTLQGCGMDMGFHLVYTIGLLLHNDGYYFQQVWI